MPDYLLQHTYLDVRDGVTFKQYEGTFIDYATARTAADAFLIDAQAATDAQIVEERLTEVTPVAGVPAGSSNVFARISATITKNDGDRYNLQLPSPVAAMLTGNALNQSAAAWTDYVANLSTGNWQISDGEHYSSTVSGKLIFVRSGKTNLPA